MTEECVAGLETSSLSRNYDTLEVLYDPDDKLYSIVGELKDISFCEEITVTEQELLELKNFITFAIERTKENKK